MKRILSIYPDAVKQADHEEDLPVHKAAKYGSLKAMEILLGVYPESATMMVPEDSPLDNESAERFRQRQINLLHLVVLFNHDISLTEAKVRFLCSRYPELLSQRSGSGNTPFIAALSEVHDRVGKLSIARLICEIGGGPELVRSPCIDPIGEDIGAFYNPTTHSFERIKGPGVHDQWLPLHFYVASGALDNRSPILEFADFFRLMLLWYPEAAGIEGTFEGTDEEDDPDRKGKTPCQLAIDKNLNPYYIRLLLRAAPDHNPAELRRLNWAERRMAMFLAFQAVGNAPTLLAQLRDENKDLVKHVISFL